MKPQPRYQPGDRIGGRYQVHIALMGGMGEVYLCLDLEEMVPYALKTFQQRDLTNVKARNAFKNEVATWIAMEKHPNIVRCHYLDTLDNQPFIRLEWVVGDERYGTDLSGRLQSGPLDLRTTLDITIDICRGLQHAHQKQPGIVHRDLKPANILISKDSLAKVTDFGLAKIVESAQLTTGSTIYSSENDLQSLHSIKGIVGTPRYMSPEQWRNEKLDIRADIYAIGCIFFEMLMGYRPFQSTTIDGLRLQHCESDIPKLSIRSDVSPQLNEILVLCLAKRREERFANIDAMLNQLDHIYQQEFGVSPSKLPTLDEFRVTDHSNRGNNYEQLGRYEQALADHNRAIELDPTYARAYNNRGSTLHALGRYEEALDDFNQAQELDSTLDGVQSNRALTYHALKNYDKALLEHNQAIASTPNWAKAYSNRGLTYAELKQYSLARADYDKAIRLDSTYAKTYLHRGKLFFSQQQYQEALMDYSCLIELDPMLPDAFNDRGLVLARMGKHMEALQDYNRALDLDSKHVTTWSNRGNLYVELERYEDAFDDYDQALQIDPTYANAYNNRGDLHHLLGEYDRALQDRTHALELHPNLYEAYFNRGNTRAAIEEYELALLDFDQAIACNPDFAAAYINKGITLDRLGQKQEALHCFENASAMGLPEGIRYAELCRYQLAVETFQSTDSLGAMRKAVIVFPLLIDSDFMSDIEQAEIIPGKEQLVAERLAWLRQIIEEGK